MDALHTRINQNSVPSTITGGLYVTTDGLVRYCVTAPLLELPHDFKEWHRPENTDLGIKNNQFVYE